MLNPQPFEHYKDHRGRLWLVIAMWGMYEHMDDYSFDKMTIQEVKHYKPGEQLHRQTLRIKEFNHYRSESLFEFVVPVIPK